ncbi:MAG: hypothetical protein LBC92_03605 [Rickettsiales bacterium]|jgi:MraZ protein|nr:hypothetical protein [Rickettsiales bacterium]
MVLFTSYFENKVDAKGRVSFPSQFRSQIIKNNDNFLGVVVYKSFTKQCFEGSNTDKIKLMCDNILKKDTLTNKQKDFALTNITTYSISLPFDVEGRIILPKNLMEQTGITDKVIFAGKNEIFEIWEPQKFNEYMKEVNGEFENKEQFKNEMLTIAF